MSFGVQHDVVRFQVPENNIVFVQCLDGADDLTNILLGLRLTKTTFHFEVLTEVAAGAKFHHHE